MLLSALPGAAVTSVRMDGALHEFSTLPGMREDLIEFLLNVKDVRIRPLSSRNGRLYLETEGPGRVTAADIQPSADFEIVNPEATLATLDGPQARLSVEFQVDQGRGYLAAGQTDGQVIGVIPVDAIFSPVRKVNYWVERARVEQVVTYDRLVLELWTDGSITPVEAISSAASILIDQLAIFRDLGRIGISDRPTSATSVSAEIYNMPIEALKLTMRTYNALRRHGLTLVGEVLDMREDELLGIKNFGRKSLEELQEKLTEADLRRPGDDEEPMDDEEPEFESTEPAPASALDAREP
jgi:DNA-directed RNA polymerase subunit alpha